MSEELFEQLARLRVPPSAQPWPSAGISLDLASALVPGLLDDPWRFLATRGARMRVLGGSLPGEERVFCTADRGPQWFARGHTLYWMTAEDGVGELRTALAELCPRWGHMQGHAGIFVSPAAACSAWHFDALDNVSIQLTGTKRWRLSDSPRVEYPTGNYGVGEAVPTSLAWCRRELETVACIEPRADVVLGPGDALFVPAGCWHEVSNLDEMSISLSFGMTSPSRSDVVVEAVRQLLDHSRYWRAPADRSPAELCAALREWLPR